MTKNLFHENNRVTYRVKHFYDLRVVWPSQVPEPPAGAGDLD